MWVALQDDMQYTHHLTCLLDEEVIIGYTQPNGNEKAKDRKGIKLD
jgi:hypothetical protein